MSASLVGSEMCIRDSGFAWFARSARSLPRLDCWPWSRCWSRSELNLRGCLLYTSDAADDM
eukprot:14767546-Alexandrium_andersonii.AAC.1